jgi:hypothetical protein
VPTAEPPHPYTLTPAVVNFHSRSAEADRIGIHVAITTVTE